MIDKLKNLGFNVEWERVKQIAGDGSIGRPHIAQALLEKGYVSSFQEAFNKYIGWGCPAYAEREKIAPEEAVRLILRAGGLPVLAHPFTLKNPEPMISELKSNGLVGIEAHYNGYAPGEITKLLGWADKYGLTATGGTDYHGLNTGNEVEIGGVEVPMEAAERLIALAKQRAASHQSVGCRSPHRRGILHVHSFEKGEGEDNPITIPAKVKDPVCNRDRNPETKLI